MSAITGCHREHTRRALGEALVFKKVKPRIPRPVIYSAAAIQTLGFCWAVHGTSCGRLLAVIQVDLVPRLRDFEKLDIDEATTTKLLIITPATIDCHLKAERGKLDSRGRSHTNRGSQLKYSIPMRNQVDWDNTNPEIGVYCIQKQSCPTPISNSWHRYLHLIWIDKPGVISLL